MIRIQRWFAAFIVLVLAGCATPLPEHIESPGVTIANVDVIGLTVLEQRYSLSLRIQNPNSFVLPVRGMSVSFSINGHEVGQGVSDAAFTLPAMGQTVREIEVVSDIERLARAMRPPPSRAPADFHLRGRLLLVGRDRPLAFEYGGAVIDR